MGQARENHGWCEEAAKVPFTSKADARQALTGQLRSKSVRIYRCPFHPGHLHVTKEWKKSRA